MGHYCTAVFHNIETDIEDVMAQYSYEDEEFQVFASEYSIRQTKVIMERYNNDATNESDVYDDLDTFMQEQYGCYFKKDGHYGTKSNPNGLYDWYEVGGRWKKILFSKRRPTFKQMRAKQDEELSDKLRFKDNLVEYMRLKMLTPRQYCREKRCFGKNSLLVKDLDVKLTEQIAGENFKQKIKIQKLFYEVICENSGVMSYSEFNDMLQTWKDGRITVVDYHS